ncbi:hypothetical protein AVEN_124564-1 [Araneus ventricosus]|uniref:Uncharacterized protein n=1 Tax=Araneus ventricosus TaxID=182803 RepID=A0A4Y2KEX0_ARAVE|nr:hypothetical protein AVEN_124564-1 [Araneus ventricosus]
MKSHINFFHISYIVMIAIIFSFNLQIAQSNPAKKPHFARSLSEIVSKTEEGSVRKGKAAPTISPESKTEIVQELEKLIKTVEGKPIKDTGDEPCNGETCTKLKKENAVLKKIEVTKNV